EVLCGSVATWLAWRMSGGAVHAIDPTQAARTLLMSLRSLAWDRRLLELFGVPRAILPELRDSLSGFGSIRVEGRDVPVTAMLGDQQAALIGASAAAGKDDGDDAATDAAWNDGVPLVNYGTGAFVLIPTGARLTRREGLLSSLAWTAAGGVRRYLLEG